ncbi:adenylate/guanylate cyclase domain-containing protein [Ruegeria arenilitoris]|uniref:adenylate/guanylate cyclase domain-containing protein n=1 Tax=Ruegeria arenilitoris TaxID=1173585 RepID=UPI00147A9AAE|nr:adenylate/guanylate cyclase domain-containing protein [Ruegeria arenilitoris]
MRIRNKLLLAITVPVGLLILQILIVNVFIRELQNAVNFISSAHETIENSLAAGDLVSNLRDEAKKLPVSFMTDSSVQGDDVRPFRSAFERLEARMASIHKGVAGRSTIGSETTVQEAFDRLHSELEATEQSLSVDAVDMDTLLERAVYLDAALVTLSGALEELNRELRAELQNAVNREREIHNRPIIAGIAIGVLTVVMLLAFTWLVVDRNFVARLSDLSRSMLAIAGGDLRAHVPETKAKDEIAEMAKALTVFRDTAVEVEENNLRQVAEARQRLIDAIESIAEGFSLYDSDDRLVLSNRRYQDLVQPNTNEVLRTGILFEEVVQAAAGSGQILDAINREEEWKRDRLRRHKKPEGPFIQRHMPDRWIEVTEHKTSDGGTVAIYADVTHQKQSELALREAKRRAEEATEQVSRKNATLEGLSAQLSKYLSPQIYSSIFSGQQTVEIASKRKKLSVLFADIVGFTETADKLESEELTNLLNNYLTEMSKIALRNGATIDKYIGDEIMMFFGDPETLGVREDAVACVQTAIEMQLRGKELEREWRDLGIEKPLRMRIGINTGYCTVGNFGSEDRMDYTIIGNEVNLAARLQTLAEPGRIAIAHETFSLVRNQFDATEAEPRVVKGFEEPVRNYLVDLPSGNTRFIETIHTISSQGLRVTLETQKMSPDDRAEAIKEIKNLLSILNVNY